MLFASLKTAKFSCSSHIMRLEALADWHFVVGAWWSTAMIWDASPAKKGQEPLSMNIFTNHIVSDRHLSWRRLLATCPKPWLIIDLLLTKTRTTTNACILLIMRTEALADWHRSQDARRKVICPWDFRTTCRVLRNSTWYLYRSVQMHLFEVCVEASWSCGLAGAWTFAEHRQSHDRHYCYLYMGVPTCTFLNYLSLLKLWTRYWFNRGPGERQGLHVLRPRSTRLSVEVKLLCDFGKTFQRRSRLDFKFTSIHSSRFGKTLICTSWMNP